MTDQNLLVPYVLPCAAEIGTLESLQDACSSSHVETNESHPDQECSH